MARSTTALLALSIHLLLSQGASAQGTGGEATFLHGACFAKLNGVDTGCDDKAVISTFPNGRTTLNVTGNILALIGFAGRQQTTADGHQVLWVDKAYINKAIIDADGQCSIDTREQLITVGCKAILKDGRLLVAGVKDASSEISAIPSMHAEQASTPNCAQTVKVHAFLTRAQFQCGYGSYSQEMIDAARRCLPELGEKAAKDLLKTGFDLFDRNERERGHNAMWAKILRDFPDVVRQ